MTINKELLDEILKNSKDPSEIFGKDGIIKKLTGALVERALEAELTDHLGYEKHNPAGKENKNFRNGKSKKTVKGSMGDISLEVPRDRAGSFEPQLVKKRQTRIDGFDDKIIAMYARGMSVRDIQSELEEIYGTNISSGLIYNVTNEVYNEVVSWQNRHLDSLYPIVYLDAIRIKTRHEGHILNKAVYLAIGINTEGLKEVLGMWIAKTEGAKFWLSVLTEIKNRGVEDIFIASVDGLKGFPDAIETVYPNTQVQLCIVHMVRHSLRYVSWKDRKEMASDLKSIYQSSTVSEAEEHLKRFSKKWDNQYPSVSKSWKANWQWIIPLFDYPPEIRKVIYTTNAIESLNNSIRKVTRSRGSFPNDESVQKIVYLALRNISKKWTMPIRNWKIVMNYFSILFEERLKNELHLHS